jgi:hypothetical protein
MLSGLRNKKFEIFRSEMREFKIVRLIRSSRQKVVAIVMEIAVMNAVLKSPINETSVSGCSVIAPRKG